MATFHNKTVLAKYLLSHFQVLGFEAIAKELRSSHLEGYTEEGNSKYLNALINRLYDNDLLTKEMLQEYDENIVRHTAAISHRREKPINWKYFQYLSLLFTEIYLDKFFSNPIRLLHELNRFGEQFNYRLEEKFKRLNPDNFVISPFEETDLNKIAYWNATGSGKTLIMHVNIKQYLHYSKKYKKTNHNKVLLITPKEGLSQQHLEEFEQSDIKAGLFSKSSGGLFSGTEVEILEITKLSEESGDKTVAVEAFETNNLVLVDEGHTGASGDKWKDFRDTLSETGFAFEYSATFGQAINAATGVKQKALEQEYAKSIIFDYSYKYFYADGYGKEYKILNLNDNSNAIFVRKYLTANLLSFYQQQLIFAENEKTANQFLLAKPLWVFVGGSVNAVRTVQGKLTSDVLEIIYFITDFVKNKEQAISDISDVLSGNAGLLDNKGNPIFYNSFGYLLTNSRDESQIYVDICNRIFNSEVQGANFYLDNLKGSDGELGLRIGNADYFGVINVGDAPKLHKLALENNVLGDEKDFSSSLFQGINNIGSPINLLIGSKKFNEGWSSWRVSNMGLMNIGRSEGSQIIQLFGRGVRLRGYDFSLKRSQGLDDYQRPDNLKELRKLLIPLETLNIFGVRADYMQKFKEFLELEGLPSNDSRWRTIDIPTIVNTEMLDYGLKVIQVKENESFKKRVKLDLRLDISIFDNNLLELDWYPKIQMLGNNGTTAIAVQKHQGHLAEENLAFIDWNTVFFEVERYKYEKNWSNLSLCVGGLKEIIQSQDWYSLYIPKTELELRRFSQTLVWQEVVIALLKKYSEKYYTYHKNLFHSEHIETRILTRWDENIIDNYELKLNLQEDAQHIQEKVHELISSLESGNFIGELQLGSNFYAFENSKHLYKPLLQINADAYKEIIKISPIPLDAPEKRFLDDIITYFKSHSEDFENRKMFLLRNQSKKGIGFFVDTNNFYPDFILWILEDNRQHIAFIDPKGIRNAKGLGDAKIQFHKLVKEKIEPQIAFENVSLSSFIVSNTRFFELQWKGDITLNEFHENNVYFQFEDKETYIGKILGKIVGLKRPMSVSVKINNETKTTMKEFGLHDGIYTISDVASIINKSTDRVRRWFTKLSEINYEGLDIGGQQDIEKRRINFHGLIELVVIGELIENEFKLRDIFKARTDLAEKSGKSYPFATNDVNNLLKVSGSDITWDFVDGNVTLDGKGQFNIEVVREFFRDIEFDTSGIAQRIIPAKGLGKIEITPKRAGGKPAIISKQGVRVETILRFYDGPSSKDDIISDYGISEEDIDAAIAFEL